MVHLIVSILCDPTTHNHFTSVIVMLIIFLQIVLHSCYLLNNYFVNNTLSFIYFHSILTFLFLHVIACVISITFNSILSVLQFV